MDNENIKDTQKIFDMNKDKIAGPKVSTMDDSLRDFYLPERMGRISQFRIFDSPLMIFKIEDASFGIDTQQNIIELLPYLYQKFGVRVICVEGAWGDFHNMEKLRGNFHPEQLKTELAKGHLSAAEFMVLTSDLPFTLHGVDNAELYEKNRQAQAQTHYGNKTRLLVRKLTKLIEVLKHSVYTPELYAFDQIVAQHEAGELDLQNLAQVFREYIHEGRIQLDGFPNLNIWMKTVEIEATIDQSELEIERSQLIRDLITILTAPTASIPFLRRVVKIRFKMFEHQPPLGLVEDYREIVGEIQKELIDLALMLRLDQVPDDSFYDLIVDISSFCDLNIRQYPNLLSYIHYRHQTKRIRHQELMEEIQQANKQIQESLFENDDQRLLARTARMLDGLHKLCSMEMSPTLFDHFNREFGQLTFATLLQEKYIQKAISSKEQGVLAAVIQSFQDVLEEEDGNELHDLFNLLGALRARQEGDSVEELERLERMIEQLTFTELLAKTDDTVEIISDMMVFTDTLSLYKNFPMLENPLVRGLMRAEFAVEGAYRFLQLASARGRSLVENTLRYMQEQRVTTAVLITGGFLTNKILPVLERELISYQVLMPKGQPSETTFSKYITNMLQGPTMSEFMRKLRADIEADGNIKNPAKNNEPANMYLC